MFLVSFLAKIVSKSTKLIPSETFPIRISQRNKWFDACVIAIAFDKIWMKLNGSYQIVTNWIINIFIATIATKSISIALTVIWESFACNVSRKRIGKTQQRSIEFQMCGIVSPSVFSHGCLPSKFSNKIRIRNSRRKKPMFPFITKSYFTCVIIFAVRLECWQRCARQNQSIVCEYCSVQSMERKQFPGYRACCCRIRACVRPSPSTSTIRWCACDVWEYDLYNLTTYNPRASQRLAIRQGAVRWVPYDCNSKSSVYRTLPFLHMPNGTLTFFYLYTAATCSFQFIVFVSSFRPLFGFHLNSSIISWSFIFAAFFSFHHWTIINVFWSTKHVKNSLNWAHFLWDKIRSDAS